MNHIYRLVWSECKRTWVVASENSRSRKKGAGRNTRKLLLTSLIASGLSLSQARADLPVATTVVPSGGNTNAYISANGVPVVNINNPNSAGLSHNTYTNYNVEANGMVLNNGNISQLARQSQLAGQIAANPNLINQASIILNEVMSNNRSTLAGFTEVLGGRADVIVANPNGITCNGCGFINTNRATLTTGIANIGSDGNLNGFTVNRGDILIEGLGANAGTQQIFDLVARSVKVDANIDANANGSLGITTGNNTWNYNSRNVTATAAASGTAPGYAIDSSALGGMYAGRIRLIASEAGVGVRMLGDAAASADDFTLNSAGNIVMNASFSAAGNVDISGLDLDNQGSISARNNTTLNVSNFINGSATNSSALISADDNVDITAADLDNQGSISAKNNATLNVSNFINGSATNSDALISADGNLLISADDLNNQGSISAKNATTINATSLTNGSASNSDALIYAALNNGGDSVITVTDDLLNYGAIHSDEKLTINASSTTNSATAGISSNANLELDSLLIDNYGAFYSGQDMTLSAINGVISNRANTGTINSNGLLTMTSTIFNNFNQIFSQGDISISATLFNNETTINGSSINKSPGLAINTPNSLTNDEFRTESEAYNGMYATRWQNEFSRTETLDGGITMQQLNDSKAQIISNSSISINYEIGTNKAALISAPSVTLTGNSAGSAFTNESLSLYTTDYTRRWITIRDVYLALRDPLPADYMLWVRTDPDAGEAAVTNDTENYDTYNPGPGWALMGSSLGNNTDNTVDFMNDYWSLIQSTATPGAVESNPRTLTGNESPAGIFANTGQLNHTGGSLSNIGSPFTVEQSLRSPVGGTPAQPTNVQLPTNPNGYFVTNNDPGVNYLVETNPRFAAGSNFIGSNYMLDRFGYDPEESIRRLGDANYEAYLIRQQLIAKTGNNILAGYDNEADQMKTLMDQAYVENQDAGGKGRGFTFGKALTPYQMASLGKDIVWMVETEVQGEKVLKPVVYLAPTTRSEINVGAVIGGENINMNLASLSNTGGTITANKTLTITTQNDITNTSGNIKGSDVSLTSTQGSIINQTHTQGSGDAVNSSTDIGKTASITSTDTLNLDANKDIEVLGANVTSRGDATINAGGDIKVDTIVDKTTTTTGTSSVTQYSNSMTTVKTVTETNVGSGIKIGGDATMTAGKEIIVRGSDVDIKGDAVVDAKDGISITDAVDTERSTKVTQSTGYLTNDSDSDSGSKSDSDSDRRNGIGYVDINKSASAEANAEGSKNYKLYETTTITTEAGSDTSSSSNFKVGGTLKTISEGTLLIQGSNVESKGDMNLDEVKNIEVLSGQNKEWSDTTTEKSSFGLYNDGTAEADANAKGRTNGGSSGMGIHVGAESDASASAEGTSTLGRRSETETESSYKLTNTGVSIKSGGNLTVNAENEAKFVGATVESQGDMNIDAKNIINEAAQDIEEYSSGRSADTEGLYVGGSAEAEASANAKASTGVGNALSGGAEGSAKAEVTGGARVLIESDSNYDNSVTNKVTTFKAGGNFSRTADDKIVDQGTQVEAVGTITQSATTIEDQAIHDVRLTGDDSSSLDVRVGVYAGGEVEATAQGDAAIAGRKSKGVGSGGEASAGFSGSVDVDEASNSTTSETAVTSRFKAGGSITSTSTDKTTLVGTQFESDADITINAKSLDYQAAQDSASSEHSENAASAGGKVAVYGSKGTKVEGEYTHGTEDTASTTAKVGSIKALGNISINTTDDTTLVGTSIDAGNRASIDAGGNVDIQAAQDTESTNGGSFEASASYSDTKGNKGEDNANKSKNANIGGEYSDSDTTTAVVSSIKSGSEGISISGKNVTLTGTDIKSTGLTTIEATQGTVSLKAAESTAVGKTLGASGEIMANEEGPGLYKKGESEKAVGGTLQLDDKVTSTTTNINSDGGIVINAVVIENQEAKLNVVSPGTVEKTSVTTRNIELNDKDISVGDSIEYKTEASMEPAKKAGE